MGGENERKAKQRRGVARRREQATISGHRPSRGLRVRLHFLQGGRGDVGAVGCAGAREDTK